MLIYSGIPQCKLCGGEKAPIVLGKHLRPETWCDAPRHYRCQYLKCKGKNHYEGDSYFWAHYAWGGKQLFDPV